MMGKPKTEVQDKDYFRDSNFFYEIINVLKNVDEIKLFLKDILTGSELRMVKKRWYIANLLLEGIDIRTVSSRAEAGIQTVVRIKQVLEDGRGGLKLALKRMKKINEEKKSKSFNKRQGSKFVKGWFR